MPDMFFDNEAYKLLCENLGEERATEVIKEYLVLVSQTIDEAFDHYHNQDYSNFAKYCHKLKSNAAYLGAKELESHCIQIEKLNYENDHTAIDAIFLILKHAAKKYLKQLIKKTYTFPYTLLCAKIFYQIKSMR